METGISMTSNKPYLLRAFYEWILDNHLTPYVVVNAEDPGVQVPQQYVDAGKIVLNVAPSAVQGLIINNEVVQFNARFAGIPMHVYAPIHAVTAIYAKENGQGMIFPEEDGGSGGTPPRSTPPGKPKPRKPRLTIVK